MEKKEFEQIYKKYANMLYRTAYRMVKNDADALDIVQEAFIRIYNGFDRFRNQANIQTWMYRIVMNLCYDHFRRRKKVSFVSEQEIFDPDGNQESLAGDNINEFADLEEQRKKNLQKALELLTLRQRTVFNLRIYEEFSYEEIARIMKVKIGTAKATFFQAVEKLKIIMKEMEKK
ncbi:MAG: sigma-70 family RNA polymerase sigma factor [Candidatus Omnitrophica bacterium]|nr:sigma-70 family RNA polymerase sigma factor [Candidatus Omnitrophota bacterium]MCM8828306.1 sigma-70 family RNA polymerase sigma factor [Candidatus Omnitrophota bacterium]